MSFWTPDSITPTFIITTAANFFSEIRLLIEIVNSIIVHLNHAVIPRIVNSMVQNLSS